MNIADALRQPLSLGRVTLELYDDARHRAGLFEACQEDPEIWQIYPINLFGEAFDDSIAIFHNRADWVHYIVIDNGQDGRIVGMTNYIAPDEDAKVVEIGGTYIAPSVRGTGFNRTMKKLMIEHAFAAGFETILWKVDVRNKRSQAAVLKLGARFDHIVERDRVTWTGHVRDSAVFAMKQDEWPG